MVDICMVGKYGLLQYVYITFLCLYVLFVEDFAGCGLAIWKHGSYLKKYSWLEHYTENHYVHSLHWIW